MPQTVPLVVTEATPPTLSSEVRPPPAAPLTLDDLQGLATRLTGDLRFAGDQEIEAAMAELVGRTLRTDLRVESVERISSFDRAEHLRGGSRLIGEVGEQLSVQVGLPATAAAAPERGDSVTVSAKLVGWDGLYRRLVLESQG